MSPQDGSGAGESSLRSDNVAGAPNARRRQSCEGQGKRALDRGSSQYKDPEGG